MSTADFRFSARGQAVQGSQIRELLKVVGKPSMISFAGGIPDPTLLGVDLFDAAMRNIFSGPYNAREALQYSTTEGHLPLRQWLAAHMAGKNVAATPDNILITTGSQQALDLIARIMLDPGDIVLTARPTYLGALQCFASHGADFAPYDTPLPLGPSTPKLIYLVPDFANPDGRTLTEIERLAALDRAELLDALVIEDAAYTELRLEGDPVPAMAAIDQKRSGSIEATRTLYCGTFSKTLSPGLRVGWLCGPKALIRRLSLLKQSCDLHTPTLNQHAVLHAAMAGFDAVTARARQTYRIRRDAMLAALGNYAPVGTTWTRPEGGMFVWVTLPPHIDASALLPRAMAQDVAFLPGSAFYGNGEGRNTMRLSFSNADEAQIEVGIYKLCALIADAERRSARQA